jgi:hypothetical protein
MEHGRHLALSRPPLDVSGHQEDGAHQVHQRAGEQDNGNRQHTEFGGLERHGGIV